MLAEQIKTYITDRGIKSSVLANKIDVSPVTFSAMMNGKRKITAEEYFAICEALDVSINFFTAVEKQGA